MVLLMLQVSSMMILIFIIHPDVKEDNPHEFLMIVLVGNLNYLGKYFDPHQEARLSSIFIQKFSSVFEVTEEELTEIVKKYKGFFCENKSSFKKYTFTPCRKLFFSSMTLTSSKNSILKVYARQIQFS